MKKFALISAFIYIFVLSIQAQEPRFIFDNDSVAQQPTQPLSKDALKLDSLNKVPPAMPAWKIDERFGERIPVPMDTMLYNFHQKSLVDGQGVAVGYLGNWGSPALSKIFFERDEVSTFNFLDAFNYYYKRPKSQRFLNTKQPYSNIMYQSGGSRQSKEERFTGEISINFNKKFSIGFDIDYVFSRGYYQWLSNKQLSTNLFASYVTDRYQMHAFIGTNAFNNSENGGIRHHEYLQGKDPENPNNTPDKNKSLNFDVNFTDTWNKLFGNQFYVTNRYNVGYEKDNGDDQKEFVPVASFILTNHYTDQQRKFYSNKTDELDVFYKNRLPQNQDFDYQVRERMAYWSFKNTLALKLNEGFRPWVKFGLTAFIEQDFRKYAMPAQSYSWVFNDVYSQNSTVIGGLLSKDKGKFLKYNLSADFGILGYNLGESRIKGDITTTINIKGKDAYIKANGYIKNLKPTFFQNHFNSKYFKWDKDFSDTRRVYIGGELYIPHTETRLSGGVENIQNHIYYDANKDIAQEGSNIQVVSFRLDQNLHYGILHWNNQVVFQTSSNENALPLPKLSLYSNLYIQVKLAKVLSIQLGVDAHYHSKYYAPGYDPALLQFYNQRDYEVGNFPFTTAYANLHLKKTRFFLMMYNIAKDFGDSNYLSLPNYPVNPMLFKFGLSWNFTN
jgi:hypothetical protein